MTTSTTIRPVAATVLIFLLVIGDPGVEAAISCGQVTGLIAPCARYVTSGGAVPPACCSGIRTLSARASSVTSADRQQACNCIKSASSQIRGLQPGLAAGLPGKCGVRIPFAISASIDCSRVR